MSIASLSNIDLKKVNCRWNSLVKKRPPQKQAPTKLLVSDGKTIRVADYVFTAEKDFYTHDIVSFRGIFHVYSLMKFSNSPECEIGCLTCLFGENSYNIIQWQSFSSKIKIQPSSMPILALTPAAKDEDDEMPELTI